MVAKILSSISRYKAFSIIFNRETMLLILQKGTPVSIHLEKALTIF